MYSTLQRRCLPSGQTLIPRSELVLGSKSGSSKAVEHGRKTSGVDVSRAPRLGSPSLLVLPAESVCTF